MSSVRSLSVRVGARACVSLNMIQNASVLWLCVASGGLFILGIVFPSWQSSVSFDRGVTSDNFLIKRYGSGACCSGLSWSLAFACLGVVSFTPRTCAHAHCSSCAGLYEACWEGVGSGVGASGTGGLRVRVSLHGHDCAPAHCQALAIRSLWRVIRLTSRAASTSSQRPCGTST